MSDKKITNEKPVKVDMTMDELSEKAVENLTNIDKINLLFQKFESIKHLDNGEERWYARELQIILDYSTWENFYKAINRAIASCKNGGGIVSDHFRDTTKTSNSALLGGVNREISDYSLSRYACYLIAMNGDSQKDAIAFAQIYFTVQTRRQEILDEGLKKEADVKERLFIRNQLKAHNKYLASTAKKMGVIEPLDYAIFQNHGYKGLYGGLDRRGIANIKGLKNKDDILDYMGRTELAANLFRATQTEEKLRNDNIIGKKNANETHYNVGKKVREAMISISGIPPEKLPVDEDIKKVERRLSKTIQKEPVIESIKTQEENIRNKPTYTSKNLWKYVLLILSKADNGSMDIKNIVTELPNYLEIEKSLLVVLDNRKDTKLSQLVRNLKSHNKLDGYAESLERGIFKITQKGLDFVKEEFKDYI